MNRLRLTVGLAAILLTPVSLTADVPAPLQQRQERLTAALAKAREAVVGVSDGQGVGSGVVVSGDGIVLTASHVVDSGRRRRAGPDRPVTITFADGTNYQAIILGKNRDADAAMLRITGVRPDDADFPYVEMGHSSDLSPGDWCFALGHPGGFKPDRTAPLRVGRILSVGHRTVVSDCSITLGDSGGPLFDLDGRLIGIHSMITSLIIENRHVAIDCWHRDWDRFLASERWGRLRNYDNQLAETSFFGVTLRWKDFVPQVRTVLPGSPADRAGLRPGDTMLSIAGQRFADRLDLGTLLALLDDDQPVEVVFRREDAERTVSLTTGHRDRADEENGDNRESKEDRERIEEIQDQLSSSRRIGPHEKRSAEQMALYEQVVKPAGNSVVAIRDGGLLLALGTVMSKDGYILTKATEMDSAIAPECILPDGRRFEAVEVGVDYANDLMLLKVPADNLTPIVWETVIDPFPGELVVIQDSRGNALIPSVVSVAARALEGSDQGFMGVVMGEDPSGVRILRTLPGGSAERNGLKADDVILTIDGIAMRNSEVMRNKVAGYKPGDRIAISYLRKDSIEKMELILTPRFINTDGMLEMYRNEELLGQFASVHAGGYPDVIQIDADIFPRQCGGPLLNLEGKGVALNIARADRVVGYSIPAARVVRVYDRLREAAAANPM